MSWNIVEELNVRQEIIKCVVVGDTAVGKTRLICARTCNTGLNIPQMLSTHVPTVWAIDQYRIHKEVLRRSLMLVDGVSVSLRLWDTFGDHEKDRKFAYGRADVVLLCFSISSRQSFNHCITKWYPEIRQYCPQTPIVLVGCKNDLRHIYNDDSFAALCNNRPFFRLIGEHELITSEMGRRLASEIGAVYYETSVYTHYGVTDVFENALRQGLRSRRQRRFWAKNLKSVLPPAPQIPYLPPKPIEPDVKPLHSSFQTDIRSLLDEGFACDVNVVVAETVFPAHRVILAAASIYFKQIFIASSETLQVDLTALKLVSPQSIASFLSFVYCGELSTSRAIPLSDIKKVATVTKTELLQDLVKYMEKYEKEKKKDEDMELYESDKKDIILETYQLSLKANLKQVCLKENLCTDVTFVVDDGECHAHRAILMARCDVMAAMFGGDFIESSYERIIFPGATKATFDICLQYLYSDSLHESVATKNAAEVIELANRLCLPHLISLVEKRLITKLRIMHARERNIKECVFFYLEISQLHNADQLFEWCQYYLLTNYKHMEPKLLRKLNHEYQAYLEKKQWPPLQYFSEKDYYDARMQEYEVHHNATGFTFFMSARKKFASCLSSFRRCKRQLAETTSVLNYFAKKTRLI